MFIAIFLESVRKLNCFGVLCAKEITSCQSSLDICHSSSFRFFLPCRGYWHGSVYIRTRTPMGAGDFGYFLDEVATLSSIRHENIQLFMGVCLDMDGGTLAIIMR